MKKKTRKTRKTLALVVSFILCISMMNLSVFAADETTPETETLTAEYSDGGIISYTIKSGTFYISTSGTYTFTMSVNRISGSGGVWVTLVKSGSNNYVLNTIVYSSFQTHVYLTAGTWILELTASNGTFSYAVSIQ